MKKTAPIALAALPALLSDARAQDAKQILDGAKQGVCELPAPPVLDGMAFSASGAFVSTIDGAVTCLRGAK
jgi:hypothetical protein